MSIQTKPRFRTLHEAGKYIAAQEYNCRELTPEDFGAIPRYVENPEWERAKYVAIVPDKPAIPYVLVLDDNNSQIIKTCTTATPPSVLNTSREWYRLYPTPAILCPDGWPEPFNHSFEHELIYRDEFELRRARSTTY